jgi:hypothetical protein
MPAYVNGTHTYTVFFKPIYSIRKDFGGAWSFGSQDQMPLLSATSKCSLGYVTDIIKEELRSAQIKVLPLVYVIPYNVFVMDRWNNHLPLTELIE